MNLQPNNLKIEQIASGLVHSLFLVKPGYVYATGSNSYGQLATIIPKAQMINSLGMIKKRFFANELISQAACGFYHSVVLSHSGDVYTFGQNTYGQLGLGDYLDRDVPCKIDTKHLNNEKVVNVHCGISQTIVETQSGDLYAFGRNDVGQLGLSADTKTNNVSVPTLISKEHFNQEKIIGVSVGYNHSVVLSENKRVYVWGFNGNGELGQGDITNRFEPIEIDLSVVIQENDHVKQVVAGYWFTSILTEQGKVYTCGLNKFGALGHGDEEYRTKLKCIPQSSFNDEKVVNLSLSKAKHIIAYTNKSNVFVWGNNEGAMLGLGDSTNRYEPTQLESELLKGENIDQFYCGQYFSFANTKEGKLFVCGWNYNGQLGLGDYNDRSSFTRSLYDYKLHKEVIENNENGVKTILEKDGEEATLKDNNGRYSMEYATENNNEKIKRMIVDSLIKDGQISDFIDSLIEGECMNALKVLVDDIATRQPLNNK